MFSVIDVTRDATKSEISKSYRQLAKKYHPDMHRDPKSKEEAEEKFKQIATAYVETKFLCNYRLIS